MRTTGVINDRERLAEAWITLDGAVATIETPARLGGGFRVLLTRNVTLSPPYEGHSGQRVMWRFEQDSVGSRTVTPSTTGFGGTTPQLRSGAGEVTHWEAEYDEEADVWTWICCTDTVADSPPYQPLIEKNAASGYAGIDASCIVTKPAQFIRAGLAASRPATGTAAGQLYCATDVPRLSLWKDTVTLGCAAAAGDPSIFQVLYEKNRASGYAGLDANQVVEKPIQFTIAGPLASRPGTGVPGQVYFHTDGTQHLTIWK